MASYRTYPIPGKTAAQVPECKTCLRQDCSLGSCACSEGPVLGQNTLMMIMAIIIYFENRERTKFNLIGPLFSEMLIFLLILICKFQNVPCALGFGIKYSKIFCRRFRTCVIILSMKFTVINYFGHNVFF